MKRFLPTLLGLAVVLLVFAPPAYGQAQTGTVSGTITDATGAVIPGAKIVLKSGATGAMRETVTNEHGVFAFDNVTPGIYSLTVTNQGFKKTEINSLDVRVAKTTDVGDVKLEVGNIDTTIQVDAATAPLVETQSAQITSSFSNRQVTQLRQGFGGLDTIAILTPGVVPGMGNINANGMQVAANGQRSRSTQFMLDGHQMNDITIGGPSLFFNNLDQVAEYQVITNQFSAENGRNLGATVNIITKSGTNNFHGAVTWEHRNSALDSKTSLQSQNNSTKPNLIDNRWRVNVGGPIVRDRLFFYGSYNGRKQPGSVSSIGTAASRALTPNGINTALGAFPTSIPLQVYRDAGPFAIPEGNPTCVAGTTTMLTLAGGPGGATTVPNVEACAVQRNVPSNVSEKEYSTKIDLATSKHDLFGRWLWRNNQFCCNGGQNGYFIDVPDSQKTLSVTHIWRFSPRMTNSFKFSWARFAVQFETTSSGNTAPISNVNANLANFSMPSGFLGFGLAVNLPQNRFLDTFQYANTWSWMVGKHSLKAGVEMHRNLTSLFFLPFINGQYVFTSTSLTDFINNTPAQVSFTAGSGTFDPKEFDQFYFVQDDIRITQNFTLNIGLRYEHNGQPINRAVDEILARESDPAQAFWLQTVNLADRTLPRQPNDNNNFAPRIGFAWTPQWSNWLFGDKQTTIRGGYGISYELAFYNILLNMTTAAPRVFAFSLTGASATPVAGTGLGSDLAAVIPVPRNTIDPRTLFQTRLSKDFHNPYGQNFSLGVQREIGRTQVMEVRYVGTNGVSLFQSINANPLFSRLAASSTVAPQPFASAFSGTTAVTMAGFPQFVPTGTVPCPAPPVTVPVTPNPTGLGRPDCTRAAIRERANTGHSTYSSLQVRYDIRNLKNQFTGGASYTWSKGFDNVSEIFGFFGDGSVAFAENPFNVTAGERGVSNQNLGQTLALHYIWDVPWFKGQNGFVGHVLGGWSVSGITTFLSGRPWTPIQRTGNRYCGQDSGFNNSFVGLPSTCRPYVANPSAPLTFTNAAGVVLPNVGYVDLNGVIHRPAAATATATVGAPGAPRIGDPVVSLSEVAFIFSDDNAIRFLNFGPFGVGRNNFRGEPTYNWDIAIDKRTKVTETIAVRYRAAFNNAFNHRNFGVPLIRADLADFAIPQKNNVAGRSIRMGLWVEF
jgi:hypothetical protein